MSTDNQLPVTADGGAVTVQPAGATQIDAAALTGALGDIVLRDVHEQSTPEAAALEVLGQVTETLWDELRTAAAVSPAQVEYAQPVLAEYAPLFQQALRAGDRAEMRRLAHNLSCDLVVCGALTVEQRERMQPILARVNPECEKLLNSVWKMATRQPLSAADVNEMRELNLLIADPGSRYWKGPDAERLQVRWRELYDRGVRGDAIPPTRPEQIDARIAEIEKLMRDTTSDYYRGPNAASLQKEYRALVDQRGQRTRRN